jgi:hypothetical protein
VRKEASGAMRTAGLSSKPSSNVGDGGGIRLEIRQFFDDIFLGFQRGKIEGVRGVFIGQKSGANRN